MVLWRAELRVSWRAQWISLLAHGVLAMIILLIPWPLNYMPLWLLLLVLVVFGCIRSQRCINANQGEICLYPGWAISWQGTQWQLPKTPWMLHNGMMLILHDIASRRTLRLWIMADSMEGKQWRDLRRLLLNHMGENPRA